MWPAFNNCNLYKRKAREREAFNLDKDLSFPKDLSGLCNVTQYLHRAEQGKICSIFKDSDAESIPGKEGDSAVNSTYGCPTFDSPLRAQFSGFIVPFLNDQISVANCVQKVLGDGHVPNFFACFVLSLQLAVSPKKHLQRR